MTVDDPWTGVTALVDPSRRILYDHVRRAGHPVSREEAADATGMSRGLAAFHLDKLVEVGLLHARYQAPPDRPRGRGRSPKVYELAGDGVAVTIPERRYQLIAEILAAAVDEDPAHADRAAARHAHREGRTLGTTLRAGEHADLRAGEHAHLSADEHGDLLATLARLGFEPEQTAGRVLLHNCPFHALATRYTTLVCGLNHAFLTGLLDGLHTAGVHAVLAPHPGRCCVELAGTGTTG